MTEPTSLRHTAASIVSPASSTETDTGSRIDADRLRVDRLVVLGLPPGRVDALPEIAAAIEQADADERHSQLRGGLEMVARQDTQAAGVDRQPLVQAELHAEVGDEELALVAAVRALPPGRCFGGRLHRAGGKLHAAIALAALPSGPDGGRLDWVSARRRPGGSRRSGLPRRRRAHRVGRQVSGHRLRPRRAGDRDRDVRALGPLRRAARGERLERCQDRAERPALLRRCRHDARGDHGRRPALGRAVRGRRRRPDGPGRGAVPAAPDSCLRRDGRPALRTRQPQRLQPRWRSSGTASRGGGRSRSCADTASTSSTATHRSRSCRRSAGPTRTSFLPTTRSVSSEPSTRLSRRRSGDRRSRSTRWSASSSAGSRCRRPSSP